MNEGSERELFKLLGDKLKKNVVLRDYVSIKVGGVADYFYVAETIEDLSGAVKAAFQCKIPYFILGGGCNVIPSDSGFPGLVIQNKSSNILFSPNFSTVIVDSGVSLGRLINLAAGRDLGGLEFLFGVPGTVGGALYGNAGANNFDIGDFVKSVTMLVPSGDGIETVCHNASWLEFAYRTSKLKSSYHNSEFKPVILTITLQLVRRRKDEILRLMHDNFNLKKTNQPVGEASAGSFFKNHGFGKENAAGYLLEQAGAKKMKVGGASFSPKHANFLVNKKGASAAEIKLLADEAKKVVKEKFDVDLDEEIEYIGRW